MSEKLTLSLMVQKYAVCRLSKEQQIPVWAYEGDFFSVTRTLDELSIVCLQNSVPEGIKCECEWRILKIEGPLDFSLIGILSKISSLLAQNYISIFAVSTYDTDYILVKEKDISKAIKVLSEDNYNIV